MSRIGKQPITIPDKVEVTLEVQANGQTTAKVKGPLGQLEQTFLAEIEITKDGNTLLVKPKTENRRASALHGLTRTLLNNMVLGVSTGFSKNLEMVGVGYRAKVEGNKLIMSLGYSHPIEMEPPVGVKVEVKDNTKITVSGYDKALIGNFAANVRAWRKPEPYKGKGVKYAGERIMRKAGKAGKK